MLHRTSLSQNLTELKEIFKQIILSEAACLFLLVSRSAIWYTEALKNLIEKYSFHCIESKVS